MNPLPADGNAAMTSPHGNEGGIEGAPMNLSLGRLGRALTSFNGSLT